MRMKPSPLRIYLLLFGHDVPIAFAHAIGDAPNACFPSPEHVVWPSFFSSLGKNTRCGCIRSFWTRAPHRLRLVPCCRVLRKSLRFFCNQPDTPSRACLIGVSCVAKHIMHIRHFILKSDKTNTCFCRHKIIQWSY
jgi:hypothetical protein